MKKQERKIPCLVFHLHLALKGKDNSLLRLLDPHDMRHESPLAVGCEGTLIRHAAWGILKGFERVEPQGLLTGMKNIEGYQETFGAEISLVRKSNAIRRDGTFLPKGIESKPIRLP